MQTMKTHNFSAGPCILPGQVFEEASKALKKDVTAVLGLKDDQIPDDGNFKRKRAIIYKVSRGPRINRRANFLQSPVFAV